MDIVRKRSTDSVMMEGWRWEKFLDFAIQEVQKLHPAPCPLSSKFLQKEVILGKHSKAIKVTANTWACRTEKLRNVRAACIHAGQLASVLNLVAKPFTSFDIPFFGADFVTLPTGHLLALDLQPVLKEDDLHTSKVWDRLLPLHKKWQDLLPFGGPLPKDSESYFSPGFLWTRLPLGEVGDDLIQEVVFPAYKEYLSLYLSLVDEAEMISDRRSSLLSNGQKRYLSYRAEKDPARGMLTKFFGNEWTEEYINTVLFER